jgi:hypothetical protein
LFSEALAEKFGNPKKKINYDQRYHQKYLEFETNLLRGRGMHGRGTHLF